MLCSLRCVALWYSFLCSQPNIGILSTERRLAKMYLISWFRQKRIINYASEINGSNRNHLRAQLFIHLSAFDHTTIVSYSKYSIDIGLGFFSQRWKCFRKFFFCRSRCCGFRTLHRFDLNQWKGFYLFTDNLMVYAHRLVASTLSCST